MKRQQVVLAALLVMLKFSQLSSAPTDNKEILEGFADNKDFKENSLVNIENDRSPNVAYVASDNDFGTAGVIFEFRRSIKSDNTEIEARRRSALDKGFMRFGRGGNGNVMRFGRSPKSDDYDIIPLKTTKNDKMRFGRSGNNPMRFGRSFNGLDYDVEESEENDDDKALIERPETRGVHKNDEVGRNVLRLGRLDVDNEDDGVLDLDDARSLEKRANLMRFGRSNMMRFGRSNPMRFGKRNPMRFGRQDPSLSRDIRGGKNMMRLGRSNNNGNLMRFGRNDKNIMRFGKRSGPESISSSTKYLCKDENCIVEAMKESQRQNQLQEEYPSVK